MTTNHAIIIGALIIAGSVFWATGNKPARADMGGPYQLQQHSNTTANVGVFRIDTTSGEVSYCFISRDNDLICSKPVK